MENKKDNNVDWDVRVGIHTGPMVAGIIGETKFSYDVWGSTVNLCARLESASKPGSINVSQEFMLHTGAFFEFEPRGLIEIKNSAPTEMYFLTDIKEPLRSGHFVPNRRFWDLYNVYAASPLELQKKEKSITGAMVADTITTDAEQAPGYFRGSSSE
jgi:hypothetical protein